MEDLIARDITEGMVYDGALTPYRAGVIKVSTGALTNTPTPIGPNGTRIGVYEERAIRAAARAQRKLGCAINTHTHPVDWTVTNPGIEMLDIMDEEGADPSKVIIGHCFIKPTLDQLTAICERGASLQIDHIGIPWMHESADALDEQMAKFVWGRTAWPARRSPISHSAHLDHRAADCRSRSSHARHGCSWLIGAAP
jgi:phosphotriesterase-related protein